MWNLKKGYKETYIQNRNRPTDLENKHVTKGKEEGGIITLGLTYTHYYI